MSFNVIESSLALGQPIRLYLFFRGSQQWGFNSSDRDIEFEGVLYKSTAITDNGIRQTGQLDADDFEVTAPGDIAPAQLYRGLPPTGPVMLTVRDMHFADEDPLVAWIGEIFSVRWPARDRAVITCRDLASSLGDPGLRLTYSRNCPHALYGRGCNVNKLDFQFPGAITGLDGLTITMAELDVGEDGFFTGGFIEWEVGPALVDRRTIESHTGQTAVMLGGTQGLEAGMAVVAFPGCPRTIDVCDSRFNNKEHFGGIPGLPGRSPFDGDPIF